MVRVLHLDDNRDESFLIRENLRRVDPEIQVVWAPSAHEALEMLNRESFDCILCDYQMPGMNGIAFLAEARARGFFTPCIFLTGQGNEKVAADALRSGADDYYTKDGGSAHYTLLHNTIVRLVAARRTAQEHELAERKRQESEALYRTLFENAGDPIFIIALDGTYLDANRSGCQALGLPLEQIVGRKTEEFDAETTPEEMRSRLTAIAREGAAVFETSIRVGDGDVASYEANTRLITFRGQSAILASLRNISERKKLFNELWLRDQAIETANSGMAFADLDGRLTAANPAALALWGYDDIAQCRGTSIFDFWAIEMDDARRKQLLRSLIEQGALQRAAPAKRRDGSVFWVYFSASVIRDRTGVPVQLFNSMVDISDLRGAEEKIRKREASINQIVSAINAGILVYSADYRIQLANPKACHILKYSENELLGTNLINLGFRVVGEDGHEMDELEQPMFRTFQRGDAAREAMTGLIHPQTGHIIWTLINTIPEYNDDGSIDRVIVSFVDITRRKEIEEDLRLRDHAVRSATIGIAFSDDEARIFYANSALAAMWAYDDPAESYGKDVFQFFANRREVLRFNTRMRSRGTYQGEMTARKRTGEAFHVHVHASRVTDQFGRFLCWMASFYDVTERKRTADALSRSEAQLRSILDNAACGIWTTDAHGSITSINATMEDLLGYSFEEIQTLPPKLLTHPEYRDESEEGIHKLLGGKLDRFFMIKRYLHKDGHSFWGNMSVTPIRDPRGSVTGSVGIVVDITNQMLAREELVRSENRFRTLFEGHDAVMFLLDPKTLTFIDVNPAAVRFWGIPREHLIGASVLGVSSPDEDEIKELVRNILDKRQDLIATQQRRGDGSIRDVEMRATALEISPGQIAIFSIINDVTERKRLERELAVSHANLHEKSRQLETLNRELESFTYTVSHDLRAPLRHIEGFSQILAKDYVDGLGEEGGQLVSRISIATRRMGTLINDLLQLSRATQQALMLEIFDLAPLATAVAAELQNREPERVVQFDIEPPMPVTADQRFMKVLLENLFSNARKFTRNSPEPRFSLTATRQGDETVYCVRDNGAGFDPIRSDKLFVPFQRLHEEREYEGTGIGLSIVQRIVQRHGGRIWAESTPGQGAAFFFTLSAGS